MKILILSIVTLCFLIYWTAIRRKEFRILEIDEDGKTYFLIEKKIWSLYWSSCLYAYSDGRIEESDSTPNKYYTKESALRDITKYYRYHYPSEHINVIKIHYVVKEG